MVTLLKYALRRGLFKNVILLYLRKGWDGMGGWMGYKIVLYLFNFKVYKALTHIHPNICTIVCQNNFLVVSKSRTSWGPGGKKS